LSCANNDAEGGSSRSSSPNEVLFISMREQ
jgi:hypothetical protein